MTLPANGIVSRTGAETPHSSCSLPKFHFQDTFGVNCYLQNSGDSVSSAIQMTPTEEECMLRSDVSDEDKPPKFFSFRSYRFLICLMLMGAFYVSASMRINLSMGITCMVNTTAFADDILNDFDNKSIFSQHGSCKPIVDEETAIADGYEGYLLWSPSQQSMLFSASFYGGLITMAFAGFLADKYGPKKILSAAILNCVCFTILGPYLAEHSYIGFFISRILMGIGIVSINSTAARWFPPNEKSTAAALYTTGNQIFLGVLGIIWCITWTVLATNTPAENKRISKAELKFLEAQLSNRKNDDHFRQNKLPLRSILCCPTMQSIYCAQFSFSLCAILVQSFLPTYFKEHLFLPIHKNGLYNSVPFLVQLVTKNLLAMLSDYLKKHKNMDATVLSKFFQCTGAYGVSFSLLLLAFLPSCENPTIALYLLAAYGLFFAGAIPGFFTALVSVAPPYAGTISSISTVYATIASIVCPQLLAALEFFNIPHKWKIIFGFCSFVQLCAGTFFLFCGSAKVQPWAQPKSDEEEGSTKT